MADPTDPTQEIQAQVLDGIRKSQEAVVDGMRAWADTVQQLVPGSAQTAAVPGIGQLPSATEVVDSVFDFAAQLLNAQRELAHSVLGATTEIGERAQEAAKAPTDAAKKPAKS